MDLIKRYGRRGSFGPPGMFFSSRLSNELLIGLRGLYNKEVVKLRVFFYLRLAMLKKNAKQRLVTLWGDAPVRPFEVQLPDESVQNPQIPRKFQVLQGDGGGERSRRFGITGGFLWPLFLSALVPGGS